VLSQVTTAEISRIYGKVIENIVCEDGLIQLLHTHPVTAQSFFRTVSNVYHGKAIKFPVDLGAGERSVIA
jgi:hypothetical protein